MRLQLSVRRHTLPVIDILFSTRSLNPDPATSNPGATIAQLLQDIHDVVPLQNDDWGLEDYAVEVNGYECLHFAPYESVLRDNDQVVIRALKTEDLRRRRLGGRHQISSDGKHLIDGVTFGREWLRKSARPVVQIPPRKRRRLELEDTEKIERETGSGLLALRNSAIASGMFEEDPDAQRDSPIDPRILALARRMTTNGTMDESSDEDNDSDFMDDEEDRALGHDFQGNADPDIFINDRAPLQITARQDFVDEDEDSEDSEETSDSEEELSEGDLLDEDAELSAELEFLREQNDDLSVLDQRKQGESTIRKPPREGNESVRNTRKRKRAGEHEVDSEAETDFNGFSSPLPRTSKLKEIRADVDSVSESGSDARSSCGDQLDSDGKAGVKPQLGPQRTISLASSTDSDDSSTSSENTSSDESDSDAESDADSSDSSSSSSQTSEVASSDVEEASLKSTPRKKPKPTNQKPSRMAPEIPTVPPRVSVPPGEGSRRTQYDNQRQKKRKRLSLLKAQGLLPANANWSDLVALGDYGNELDKTAVAPMALVDQMFAAKKQELLGQVEEMSPQASREPSDASAQSARLTPRRSDTPRTDTTTDLPQVASTPLHIEGPTKKSPGSHLAPAPETRSELPKQRARLDLESSRNMIFNGLGVRKPKTAAAEKALREKLDRPAKGALPKQLFKSLSPKPELSSKELEQPDVSWRSKLVVSAVECELEGITLKEPPFPFVQGWDEDANRRSATNKKKNRNNRQYYDYGDDSAQVWQEKEPAENSIEDISMLEDDSRANEILEQLTTETSVTKDNNVIDDLPRPDNINQLDPLQQQDAVPGTVIAYKELHMSATYQPEISEYRVARVEAIQEDGSLELSLSKQDRTPSAPIEYDSESGERIVSKFNNLGEEDEMEEDDGSRTVSFADLIEPKVIDKPTTSEAWSSNRSGPEPELHSAQAHSVKESTILPGSASSYNTTAISTRPDARILTVTETDIEVTTPRRTEISALMKDAGFNSGLDEELLQPVDGVTDDGRQSSPVVDISTRLYSNSSRKTSVEAVDDLPVPDTSGFDSPRFNGWSSSIPNEADEEMEENEAESMLRSFQNGAKAPKDDSFGSESPTPKVGIRYPRISQLDLGVSVPEDSALDPEVDDGEEGSENENAFEASELVSDPVAGDPDLIDDESGNGVEDARLDSLGSVVPPSVDGSQEVREAQPERRRSSFLGGLDGNYSSDDDDLPSLEQLTSSARLQPSRVSPPVIRSSLRSTRKGKIGVKPREKERAEGAKKAAASSVNSDDEAFEPFVKRSQSQSQVRLSQIPAGSQVVDLTFSSDPASPGNSDGDYANGRWLRSSSGGKENYGSTSDKSMPPVTSEGLGNRRFLKSRKTKRLD